MKKTLTLRALAALLCLLLALTLMPGCSVSFGGGGGGGGGVGAALLPEDTVEDIKQTEDLCGKIAEIVQWQLDATEDDDSDYAEVVTKNDELKEIAKTLSGLKTRADALASDDNEASKAAVEAARRYYAELTGACADLDAMFVYFMAIHEAMSSIENFEEADNTTGRDDYALFAGQLSQVISQAQTKMKSVTCPAYMTDSQKAFTTRLDEFQSFCQDFSVAVQLNDMLRIASCVYRIQRLTLMIDQCGTALNDDFNLQFNRVKERLEGPISQLRGELLKNEKNVVFSYTTRQPKPKIDYTLTESIFPSLYRSLVSVVSLTATCEDGEKDVLIEVEIPGFTQKYSQKVTLTEQITKLNIHPPLLTGNLNLSNEKDAQVVVAVTDMESGKTIEQDSKSIKIKSKYDAIWWTPEYEDMNTDNILAWLTPESPGVLELKRNAIDYLSYVTDGAMNAFVGYQDYGYFENPIWNTWYQAVALQGAMSDVNLIRYNNASFSVSSEAQQRVMLPDDVVASKSGICIETALLMASALKSAGMHPMLVFPPGHAQVAVETWPSSGEYFLIETTVLPMAIGDLDEYMRVVQPMTADEWADYIFSSPECYVLDCDLGQKLGILPMSN